MHPSSANIKRLFECTTAKEKYRQEKKGRPRKTDTHAHKHLKALIEKQKNLKGMVEDRLLLLLVLLMMIRLIKLVRCRGRLNMVAMGVEGLLFQLLLSVVMLWLELMRFLLALRKEMLDGAAITGSVAFVPAKDKEREKRKFSSD